LWVRGFGLYWDELTSVGIAREVTAPGDKGTAGVFARGNLVAADSTDDGAVRKGRLGSNDAVGDVVVKGLQKR